MRKKLSEEHRRNLSIAHQGHVPSEETRRRMSIAHKGFRHSEESKCKMSLAQTKRNISANISRETRRKMSESHKNKRHTKLTKQKMRLSQKKYWEDPEAHEKRSRCLKGRKVSSETRKKISEALKGKHCSLESIEKMRTAHKGKPLSQKHKEAISRSLKGRKQSERFIARRLKAISRKPTHPELQLQSILDLHFPQEYKYVGNGTVWFSIKDKFGKLYHINPDFINCNGKKLIIEMFGNYWHKDDDGSLRAKLLNILGFRMLIIWESELPDTKYVVEKIVCFHRKGVS